MADFRHPRYRYFCRICYGNPNDRDRLKLLEREVKELRRANEILRKASAYFAQAELDRLGKW